MGASEKQVQLVERLLTEKVVPDAIREIVDAKLADTKLTPGQFSKTGVIDLLFGCAEKDAKPTVGKGTYKVGADTYKVVESKAGKLYAKVQRGGTGKFVYEPGLIHEIPADTVSEESKPKPVLPVPTFPVSSGPVKFTSVMSYQQHPDTSKVAEGIYLLDGTVYQVTKAKYSFKKYVKRLDPATGKFVYAPGAIFKLAEAEATPVTAEQAQEFGLTHGMCIKGHPLTDPLSIALGIGPDCCKHFTGMTQHQLYQHQHGHKFGQQPQPVLAGTVQGTL